MKKENDSNKPDMLQLVAIAEAMYEAKPVYELVEFEEELRTRWEEKTGRKVDETKKTKTGRTEWRNIADWVKARHTRYDQTVTFHIGDKEYRAWLKVIGKVRGEYIAPASHLTAIILAMKDIIQD